MIAPYWSTLGRTRSSRSSNELRSQSPESRLRGLCSDGPRTKATNHAGGPVAPQRRCDRGRDQAARKNAVGATRSPRRLRLGVLAPGRARVEARWKQHWHQRDLVPPGAALDRTVLAERNATPLG